MKIIKVFISWVAAVSFFILIFVLFINLFLSLLLPLRYAHIPKETIDFFKNLPEFIDIGFGYNPNPDSTDFVTYEPVDSMLCIQDSLFIVFYSRNDSATEISNAQQTLKQANKAVPELLTFMKNYPYPYKVNKRKLPIYLASNTQNYIDIQKKLSSEASANSIGVYIFEYSPMGSIAKGIVLSPEAHTAFSSIPGESLKITLWHEMNHFVYFSFYDFLLPEEPYLWYFEGCAEYFAGNVSRLEDIDKTESTTYKFSDNTISYSAYWVGYTAFLYFGETYGKNKLSSVVSDSYNNPINKSLSTKAGISLDEWERGWRNYIKKKK